MQAKKKNLEEILSGFIIAQLNCTLINNLSGRKYETKLFLKFRPYFLHSISFESCKQTYVFKIRICTSGGRILLDIKGEFSWTKWMNSRGHFSRILVDIFLVNSLFGWIYVDIFLVNSLGHFCEKMSMKIHPSRRILVDKKCQRVFVKNVHKNSSSGSSANVF